VNLSEIFIRRPVATTLLAVAAAGFGLSSYFKLPVSDLPQIEFPAISVSATYPGAAPDTMVSTVTAPLERELSLVQGITSIHSVSSLGSCSISLTFSSDRKINDVAQDVQHESRHDRPRRIARAEHQEVGQRAPRRRAGASTSSACCA